MNKNRLETFSDAIIAIAATIMVLELHIPENVGIKELFGIWPVFLAYFISFTLIYTVWFNHHNLFKKANFISKQTYLFNGIWLFYLTLVPFTSNWVGHSPNETLPELLFILDIILWSLMFQVLDWQVLKDNPEAKKDITTNPRYRFILYTGYIIALISTFLVPIWGLLIVSIIIIFLGVKMFFD